MSTMTLLQRLKIDLGILNSSVYDSRLESLIDVAKKEISNMGITLDTESVDDDELIIDYARDLWQNRRGQNPENDLSKTLRARLNNRLFGRQRTSQSPEVNENDG